MSAASVSKVSRHLEALRACRRCPKMFAPVVVGEPAPSQVILVGQAPGDKEPKMGRPFAWTAGKTLFRWFSENTGVDEATFRTKIYMAAVCRCFPGKKETGGDRVPDPSEIQNCRSWLDAEIKLLKPRLILPVGKLAIEQFLGPGRLDAWIGEIFSVERAGETFDLIPLPHPSGASPWHRMEPGKGLLKKAMQRVKKHPAFRASIQG